MEVHWLSKKEGQAEAQSCELGVNSRASGHAGKGAPCLPHRVAIASPRVSEGAAQVSPPRTRLSRYLAAAAPSPDARHTMCYFKLQFHTRRHSSSFISRLFCSLNRPLFFLTFSVPLKVMGRVHDSRHPQNCLALRLYSESFNGALMSGTK